MRRGHSRIAKSSWKPFDPMRCALCRRRSWTIALILNCPSPRPHEQVANLSPLDAARLWTFDICMRSVVLQWRVFNRLAWNSSNVADYHLNYATSPSRSHCKFALYGFFRRRMLAPICGHAVLFPFTVISENTGDWFVVLNVVLRHPHKQKVRVRNLFNRPRLAHRSAVWASHMRIPMSIGLVGASFPLVRFESGFVVSFPKNVAGCFGSAGTFRSNPYGAAVQ